jgi:hypothetical protein
MCLILGSGPHELMGFAEVEPGQSVDQGTGVVGRLTSAGALNAKGCGAAILAGFYRASMRAWTRAGSTDSTFQDR